MSSHAGESLIDLRYIMGSQPDRTINQAENFIGLEISAVPDHLHGFSRSPKKPHSLSEKEIECVLQFCLQFHKKP